LWAIARLAFQEAVRKKVLVAFFIFVLVMLFASWYLDVQTDQPARLYMAVVLGWTNLLVLILALFLSTFSLPGDMKTRTIYTVVTKPVRIIELVLGRMLGFTLIGTLILVVMCILSYFFVWRGLSHSHEVEVASLVEDSNIKDEEGNIGQRGRTTEDDYHRHTVEIEADGRGLTDVQKGHRHRVTRTPHPLVEPVGELRRSFDKLPDDVDAKALREMSNKVSGVAGRTSGELRDTLLKARDALEAEAKSAGDDDERPAIHRSRARSALNFAEFVVHNHYVVGPPVGQMQARMPQYGKLTFLDRAGRPTDKGINVGNEWTYRSYIEGGSLAAAIWTFDGVTARRFPENKKDFEQGVPIDLTLRVFRTYKGDIEKGILGSLEIVEYLTPEEIKQGKRPLVSQEVNFRAQEFTADRMYIPRRIKASYDGVKFKDYDLFDDLAHDGKLIIRIQCLEKAQYYGAAAGDVYLWTGNNWFWLNFAKGYAGIWFQMVIVIAFGVMFSTFLSGPVAMLATVMTFATGYFKQFVLDVASGKAEGGGPFESAIRLIEQRNQVTELDEGLGTTVITSFDGIMLVVMRIFTFVLPDFGKFSTAAYVSQGYNIPGALMTQHFIVAALFFLVLGTIGYFVFKSREVAQ
jgi:ABC-type transport system involved in multi-copper enzyme maturation permease subunit